MLSNIFSQLRNKTASAVAPFKQPLFIPQFLSFKFTKLDSTRPRIATLIFAKIQQPPNGTHTNAILDKPIVSENLGFIRPQFFEQPILKISQTIADTDFIQTELAKFAHHIIGSVDIPFEITTAPLLHDLTEQYREFTPVNIVNIPLLTKVRIDGKTYHIEERKPHRNIEEYKPPAKNNAERADAGSRKNRTSQERKLKFGAKKTTFSIFDLIFPILHLPLGEGLNNAFAFPEGKTLYPFQAEGVNFLVNRNAVLLGDETGLGKSIQIITAIRVLYRQGKITSASIVCPKAVLSDWETKFNEWSPELRVTKVSGGIYDRMIQWKIPAHVYICAYGPLRRDWETVDKLQRHRKLYSVSMNHFDLIVLDEIQKTKNPSAQLTKTVRNLQTNYRWGLSGTPFENGIKDLITICQTLKPDMFGGRPSNVVARCYDMKIIKETYQPYFLRRRVKDVMKDMPEKITHEVWLDLSPKQQAAYIAAEQYGISVLNELDERVTLSHALALVTKLKVICNYYDGESVKLDYLQDKLEDLTEGGNKALVFSQFPNETLKKIAPKLQSFNPVIYDGSLSDSKRTVIVNNFQQTEENKVMLLSSKAGNAGITLTRANYVYHFDMMWNPAVANQAVGRALRIGQTKTVFERFLLTKGTIEEKIYDIVKEKQALFNNVVDDLSDESAVLKNLTPDEIRGLFGLTKPKKSTESEGTPAD